MQVNFIFQRANKSTNFKQNTLIPYFSHDAYRVAEAHSEHFALKQLLPTEHQKRRYARRLILLKKKKEQIYESSDQSINCKHRDTVSFTAFRTAISG